MENNKINDKETRVLTKECINAFNAFSRKMIETLMEKDCLSWNNVTIFDIDSAGRVYRIPLHKERFM